MSLETPTTGRAVLVPGCLALLPSCASLVDPIAPLRAACLSAVAWLGPSPVILGSPQGERVGRSLVAAAAAAGDGLETVAAPPPQPPRGLPAPGVLVVGNGSACRTEKAPGYFDERAAEWDLALRAALVSSSEANWPSWELGEGVLASLDGIRRLPEVLPAGVVGTVDYDDDPFGVQYWVIRWEW